MSRSQTAMIPASLCISQLLTYFLGNLKAFFHSALEITKDSLNSMGSLLPVNLPYNLMAVAVQFNFGIFSVASIRVLDKLNKYCKVKRAFFRDT